MKCVMLKKSVKKIKKFLSFSFWIVRIYEPLA